MGKTESGFFDEAAHWLSSMRRALEEREGGTLPELTERFAELEQRGARLADDLRHKTCSASERERLLEALRELRREAVVCAALFESDLLTLNWSLLAARGAGEYHPDGTVSGATTTFKEWST